MYKVLGTAIWFMNSDEMNKRPEILLEGAGAWKWINSTRNGVCIGGFSLGFDSWEKEFSNVFLGSIKR